MQESIFLSIKDEKRFTHAENSWKSHLGATHLWQIPGLVMCLCLSLQKSFSSNKNTDTITIAVAGILCDIVTDRCHQLVLILKLKAYSYAKIHIMCVRNAINDVIIIHLYSNHLFLIICIFIFVFIFIN